MQPEEQKPASPPANPEPPVPTQPTPVPTSQQPEQPTPLQQPIQQPITGSENKKPVALVWIFIIAVLAILGFALYWVFMR